MAVLAGLQHSNDAAEFSFVPWSFAVAGQNRGDDRRHQANRRSEREEETQGIRERSRERDQNLRDKRKRRDRCGPCIEWHCHLIGGTTQLSPNEITRRRSTERPERRIFGGLAVWKGYGNPVAAYEMIEKRVFFGCDNGMAIMKFEPWKGMFVTVFCTSCYIYFYKLRRVISRRADCAPIRTKRML